VEVRDEVEKLRQGDVYAANTIVYHCAMLGTSYEEHGTSRAEVLAGLRAMVADIRSQRKLTKFRDRLQKLVVFGFSYDELGVTAADLAVIRFIVGLKADRGVSELRQGTLHWFDRYWRVSRIADAVHNQWATLPELGITLADLQGW
jgi:hypothetical protein